MKKLYPFFIVVLGLFVIGQFSSCRDWEAVQQALEMHSIEGAEYVGVETCALCHEAEVKHYNLETHHGTSLEEGEEIVGESCESCHGPGSLHVESDGDKTKIIRESSDRCFACHMDKKMAFNLQYHHPVIEGQMTCGDCHDVHSRETAFHGVTDLERNNEKCFNCHKELKGPFVFEHDPMRDGCQVCHDAHGSVYNKMLVADENTLCLRCHWEANVNEPGGAIGGVMHGGGAGNYFIGSGEECIDHHRAPHGSNIWRTFNR